MHKDMIAQGDQRDPNTLEIAYLAIPFLGPESEPVLILYADCKKLNFFAKDVRIRRVTAMCKGFCRLFDSLHRDPFPNLRNFPLPKGEPVKGEPTLYSIQESLKNIDPPQFKAVSSFNYEASVA